MLHGAFRAELCQPGLGETLQQIMAALNSGNGQGGKDGYGLFNEDVALYGPNVQLAGEQAGGSGERGEDSQRRMATFGADAPAADTLPDAPPAMCGCSRTRNFRCVTATSSANISA
jgi:hypothetical protein